MPGCACGSSGPTATSTVAGGCGGEGCGKGNCGCGETRAQSPPETLRARPVGHRRIGGTSPTEPKSMRVRAAKCGTGVSGPLPQFARQDPVYPKLPTGRQYLGVFGAVELLATGELGAASVSEALERYRRETMNGGGRLFPVGANCPAKVRGGELIPAAGSKVGGSTPGCGAGVFSGEDMVRFCRTVSGGGSSGGGEDGETGDGRAPTTLYLGSSQVDAATCAKCTSLLSCTEADLVRVQLAEVDICLPGAWFYETYAKGFMHEDTAVSILWGLALGRGGETLDRKKWTRLVDCMAIQPAEATSGRSYAFFFEDRGAHWETLYYTCDLVHRFSDFITDEWSGSSACTGFGGFVHDVLEGEERDGQGDYRCKLSLRVMSRETGKGAAPGSKVLQERQCRRDGDHVEGWTMDCRHVATDSDVPEGVHADSDPGGHFDAWQADLWEGAYGSVKFWTWTDDRVSSEFGAWVGTSQVLGFAHPSQFAIHLSAEWVAWTAWNVDWTMFWARALLQYYLTDGAADYLRAALVLARSAWTRMLLLGDVIIHETGHVYMGEAGHCATGACCFDMAARAWQIRCSAYLGAPASTKLSCDTYTSWREDECRGCGEDSNVASGYVENSWFSHCDPMSRPVILGFSECGKTSSVC